MLHEKLKKLKGNIRTYYGVIVAFSGGVDSSLLLKISKDVLGKHVIAVTAISLTYSKNEAVAAQKIAKKLKCEHIFIKSKELKDKRFIKNPRNRCYYCKKELFGQLEKLGKKYEYIVIEASNKSDLQDYRPGLKAIRELGIKSPFIDAEIDKKEIRLLAKKYHLPNWDKPSMACLASRIPYGKLIDRKVLKRIESAEHYLKKLRLTQVRVRDYYPIARIEVFPNEFKNILNHRAKIIKYFKRLNYKYITLDLEGYQTGSMNR